MFFRNLTLFRFPAAVAAGLQNLDEALDGRRLAPCGPLDMTSRGAVSPYPAEDDALTLTSGDFTLLCVGSEDKLLPASVVNREVLRRVRTVVAAQGRSVGGRERKRIKAQILDELVPRAFARPSRLPVYADRRDGWLVLDTASRKAAEDAVSSVRDALGSFPVEPLAPAKSPRDLMTAWLTGGDLPDGLELADECELRDVAGNGGAIVRCRHQELDSGEIREHLRTGKQACQLGLSFNGRIGFVLGEDLVIRKLRFFDVVTDELDAGEPDSANAELEASFALMTLEIRSLLQGLERWFGVPRPADA